jgi:protein-S-isoprenylcysteine O-methyltransferase Ste14
MSRRSGAKVTSGEFCGLTVPAVYFVTGAPRFAGYSFHPFVAWLGVVVLVSALMLFFHTHSRLGRYWSVTLEIRENHGLVTDGIYRFVRHPMYSAYFLWTLAQALLLPNWIAGPAGLVGFGTLFTFRVRREERMMLQNFGDTYAAYAARTKRIIPGVFLAACFLGPKHPNVLPCERVNAVLTSVPTY